MPEIEAACEPTSAYPRSCYLQQQHCQVPWTSSTAREALWLTILHPFYIVDDSKAGLAPAIGGYDLMKSGRMVLAIDNQLLWSRLTHSLTEQPSLNPTTSIPNTNVRSVVCFAELPPRYVEPPAVPSEPDAVDPDPASIAPERSSLLSRQVKIFCRL